MSQLPKAVEELSFKDIFERKKNQLKLLLPEIADNLVDSDPAIALLEESTYTEGLLRNKLNHNILAVTVQYATGSDLENLGAFYGIKRKLIENGDNNSIPPKSPKYESDDDLRRRILEAPKGFSVAGPRNSYIYHGKLADNKVKDISVVSPSPGEIHITVLSYEGNGSAHKDLLDKVTNKLNDDDIRPLGDKISVKSAEIINFEVKLELDVQHSPNTSFIIEHVKNNIQKYVTKVHQLGKTLRISGIYAACHEVKGVNGVLLKSPQNDIIPKIHQAVYCGNIQITVLKENLNIQKEEK